MSVQCDIYGAHIGATDKDGKLGSSRIEALRFIERLAQTRESQFILQSPPTSLTTEEVTDEKDVPAIYQTKTPLVLSLKYTPFSVKS